MSTSKLSDGLKRDAVAQITDRGCSVENVFGTARGQLALALRVEAGVHEDVAQ